MVELDFEVPISKMNKIMEPLINQGIFLRWALYNKHRDTAALRVRIPEGDLEEVLFRLAQSYGDALEITVVSESEGFRFIDQAFINAVHLDGKTYPVVVIMQYRPEMGAFLPTRITVITSGEFPIESLSGVLRSRFGTLGFDNQFSTKIVHRNTLTRIMISP
ncbi:hypothetical protein A3L09_07390 [Thermococcus profundus]|uniref:Uncharacterized protein n=1 Tax=Thermococcus profundus TaxID=49899 RepID=A0A2Z2MME3_THEPR|nr:hypothetical protein [Thermococcus profundus]ASJ03088.1 hypothetical protein A3L09_07390 [Thermococcus profundus]